MLARDFIYDRLYNKDNGYFIKEDLQVGSLWKPLNFKEMMGYEDYQK